MGQLDRYNETITQMNIQRNKLGISYPVLARMSGMSTPTVTRILSGKQSSAHFDHMLALADALGMDLQARVITHASTLLQERAREKARQIVQLVQGTSSLEAQSVDEETLQGMIQKTVHELLAGSPRNLWAE